MYILIGDDLYSAKQLIPKVCYQHQDTVAYVLYTMFLFLSITVNMLLVSHIYIAEFYFTKLQKYFIFLLRGRL